MPLPNTSPDMSPMPTTVNGSFITSVPISRKCRLIDSQAPRAVIPSSLWSYPVDPPEANASPSQYPYSAEMAFAVSENVAVPLSAATTRYGSSSSATTTDGGCTTAPSTRLSVRSSMLRTKVSYWRVASSLSASGSSIACLRTKPPFAPVGTLTPVGPADAAASHPTAAEVDRLHLGGVDEDLEQRGRLGHLRDGGRPQLERDRAAPRDVHVRSDRRVDDPERVTQDPVLLEGAHGVQVRTDPPPQGLDGFGISRLRGIEPHLEQPHELRGDDRVGGEGVVLVLDRERRVHPVVVLAVGAQDLHLSPVDAGRHDETIERVGLALPAPHGADALGDARPRGLDVDRPVLGVEDAEIVEEAFLAFLAEQGRRP